MRNHKIFRVCFYLITESQVIDKIRFIKKVFCGTRTLIFFIRLDIFYKILIYIR